MMVGLLLLTSALALISDYFEQHSKKTVAEKSEESAMIKHAVDEFGDGVMIYNIKNDQLYTNKRVSQLIGYSSEELFQHGVLNIAADRKEAEQIYYSTLEGNSWYGEVDIESQQGQVIPTFVRTDAARNEEGEIIALIAILRDISKQKQFQASLKESKEKYKLVTENATDAIWLRDLNLNLTYMSPSIEKIRGFTSEEIQAMPFEKNLTPESMEKVSKVLKTELAQAMDNPEKEIIIETQNYCKDGSLVWVEDHVKFLKDEHDNPVQIIGVTRNIDERKKAEEQLKAVRSELIENAHRAGMADIAAGTLHNVGNLLNSVKTSTHAAGAALEDSSVGDLHKANQFFLETFKNHEDFAKEGSNGKKLQEFYLFLEKALKKEQNTVKKEIERLQNKIDSITDVIASQQRFAGFSSLSEEYSLETLVNDVLEIESTSLNSLGVKIRKEFKAIPDIQVQKTKLLHILVNLIKNAQDALCHNPRKNRKLLITLDQSEENVFLRVIDNGIGITKEDQQKIFSHGFSTKTDGFGFGLHSSAIYMDDMGGKIWFESDGLNKGTAFILKFPLSH
jgi:PAS domain S-box-containing protein